MLRQCINKHFIVVRRAFVLLSLFILVIASLSSCQIEKRQYVRGLFVNKSTCEFDASESSMDSRDTLTIPRTSEVVFLEQIEPVIEINSENTIPSENEIGSYELCAQPFIKSQNKHFFKRKSRYACKHQKSNKDYFSSNKVFNNEPKKIHPLAIAAASILLFEVVLIGMIINLNITFGITGLILSFFTLPIGAIILLLLARSKTKKNPEEWKGLGCITASLISLSIAVLIIMFNFWTLFS